MPVGHLYVFFGKISIQVFCPFLTGLFGCCFFMLSCMSCLHILNINPLILVSFADIFSHSIDCLFFLLMISFATQKLLHLIRSHLFIFAFVSFTLGDYSYIFSNRKYTLTLFSSIHSAFKKNYYIPCHRESLNKLQRMVF